MSYVQECIATGSLEKFSSIMLPLTLIEYRRSCYDIYWSWISWMYRDKAYYSQLNIL